MTELCEHIGNHEFCTIEYEKWFDHTADNATKLVQFLGLETEDFATLTRQVLDAVPSEATTIDTVITSSNLSPPQVLATLSVLEMRRLVRRLGGNLVMRL
jgi:predicted Rossmann fold nucleotide-binding protein DprA/Smf involved in DNA uptake